MGILVLTILEGMPFEITTQEAKKLVDSHTQKMLNTDFFVTVPLKAKDKILGAILVDNIFNKKPISKADVKMLTMFANHAGLAIENSRLYEETVYLSSIDWSTKLWNYGKFQQKLSYQLERSKINNTNVSLVMIDVDNFKHYNDTLGHKVGDLILKEAAARLRSCFRGSDTLCRYGGDEFVALAEIDASSGCIGDITERIRLRFDPPAIIAGSAISIGVSVGMAEYRAGEDLDRTIKAADGAMYADKAARNDSRSPRSAAGHAPPAAITGG
jgi:diguanylate cyclase (GGDEF)-like protein